MHWGRSSFSPSTTKGIQTTRADLHIPADDTEIWIDGTWPGIILSFSKLEDFFFILLQFWGGLGVFLAPAGQKGQENGAVGIQTPQVMERGCLNVATGHPKKFWGVIPNLSFCMNSHKPESMSGQRGMQ